MATLTKNYSLTKPDGSDKAQVSVLNADFDLIDEQMKANSDAAAAAKEAADAKQDPITVDKTATSDSNNPISSAVVYELAQNLQQADTQENERATKAEQTNAQAISQESERAAKAEQANADNISKNAEAITAEAERAEKAEKSNADAIASEAKRAKEAEAAASKTLKDLGLEVVDGILCVVYNK